MTKAEFWVPVQVDLDVLAIEMANEIDQGDLIQFVKALDERVGDWDFTRALRDLFNGMTFPEEEE